MDAARIILHVEDSPDDAELVAFALRKLPFTFDIRRVEDEPGFTAAFDAARPHVVICDYELPRFSATRALALSRARVPDIPFILVSHHPRAIADKAVDGANAFVSKSELSRLAPVVLDALGLTPRN